MRTKTTAEQLKYICIISWWLESVNAHIKNENTMVKEHIEIDKIPHELTWIFLVSKTRTHPHDGCLTKFELRHTRFKLFRSFYLWLSEVLIQTDADVTCIKLSWWW